MIIKMKPFLSILFLTFAIGGLAAFITYDAQLAYDYINKPNLSPPKIIFPIVWSILYLLMAISAYQVYESNNKLNKAGIVLYIFQLFVNFAWPIIFFNFKEYLLAFIILILLIVLVISMIIVFFKIKPLAGYLQIPYLLWLLFAAYLNWNVYLLN